MKASKVAAIIGGMLSLAYATQTINLSTSPSADQNLIYLNVIYAIAYAITSVVLLKHIKVGSVMAVLIGGINAVRLIPSVIEVERGVFFIISHAVLMGLASTYLALALISIGGRRPIDQNSS